MATKLIYVRPIRILAPGQVEVLEELDDQEMRDVLERAERVGFSCESSVVEKPPYTDRIKLNDPNREGYHRDYLARIERPEA